MLFHDDMEIDASNINENDGYFEIDTICILLLIYVAVKTDHKNILMKL